MKFICWILIVIIAIGPDAYAVDKYIAPASATPAGIDSNSGADPAHPWLTTNHPMNCNDKLHMTGGAYSAGSFSSGNWGTVSNCGTGDLASVAWLWCDHFPNCVITGVGVPGMFLTKGNWGVFGVIITTTGTAAPCFMAMPLSASFNHIVFANDYGKGCISSGFTTSSNGPTLGIDYIAFIGVAAFDATKTNDFCDSGGTMYEPIKSDSLPGSHNYVGGSFFWHNFSPLHCAGGSGTFDGNGYVNDDFGNVQSGGVAYDQETLVENNYFVFNGGYGSGMTGNGSSSAKTLFRQNTSVNNLQATNSDTTTCGNDTLIGPVSLVTYTRNLNVTKGPTACHGPTTLFNFAVFAADATDNVFDNLFYSASGNNTTAVSSPAFTYGTNVTGVNPNLANPIDPGEIDCTGTKNVRDCMAPIISGFAPTNPAAIGYGAQAPLATGNQLFDKDFPKWLCNIGIDDQGLITMPCQRPGPPTGLFAVVTKL